MVDNEITESKCIVSSLAPYSDEEIAYIPIHICRKRFAEDIQYTAEKLGVHGDTAERELAQLCASVRMDGATDIHRLLSEIDRLRKENITLREQLDRETCDCERDV